MYKCPKCGEETISKFNKFMLGPGRTIRCSNCNSRVSVSWWTLVIFISVYIGIWIVKEFINPRITIIPAMVLMGCCLFVHMYFIPLELRKEKNED